MPWPGQCAEGLGAVGCPMTPSAASHVHLLLPPVRGGYSPAGPGIAGLYPSVDLSREGDWPRKFSLSLCLVSRDVQVLRLNFLSVQKSHESTREESGGTPGPPCLAAAEVIVTGIQVHTN